MVTSSFSVGRQGKGGAIKGGRRAELFEMLFILAALSLGMVEAQQTTSQPAASPTSPSPTASPSPSAAPPAAEEQEKYSSLALFVVLSLLIGSFWTSYYLKVKRITAVHETIVGLFAGMFVGAALRVGPGEQVQKMLSFSNTIMLNVLLPPIILASGYDLRQENFFRNFGIILTFAFAGTFISAIVVGVIVYLWSLLHLESLSLTLLECLIFGSTLSATDPVTILAIFNTYKVDPELYSIIFGESLLNDAVSIVMFEVLSTFRGKAITIASLFHGMGLFLFVFTFSMALGVGFGLCCSLMLKHSRLSTYPQLESCLVALIAYTSYFFSNGVTMSGIVSLLFCGITLKHYAYHNMSRRTQRATKYIFQTLANLSENFIFIYLGLSMFTQTTLVYKPIFICITVAAVVFSRYAAVFPIAAFINMIKRARLRRRNRARAGPGSLRQSNPNSNADEELPREYQMMLFWAGLRGAVGFALSAGIEGQNAEALQTTVLVAVVITVIVFGGTTAQMLEILGIKTGVEDEEGDSTDEEEAAEIAQARLKSMRRRRNYTNGSAAHGKSMSTSAAASSRPMLRSAGGAYRDEEDLPGTSPAARPGQQPSWASSHSASYDDDDSDSSSTEVLPSARRSSSGIYYGGGGGGVGELGSSNSSGHATPESASRRGSLGDALSNVADLGPEAFAGEEERRSVGKFLQRAGLIVRDGRWFSTLDQRYLTPLFTNSVASRKHEERRAMRRSEVALVREQEEQHLQHHHGGSGGSRSLWRDSSSMNNGAMAGNGNRSSLGPNDSLGPLGQERDADVLEEEDEDDEDDDGAAAAAAAFSGGATGESGQLKRFSGSSGRATPRRTHSRTGSDDATGKGSEGKGGVAGAFAPSSSSPATQTTGRRGSRLVDL